MSQFTLRTEKQAKKEYSLTEKQKKLLYYVKLSGPVTSGCDGSQLRSLHKKGLVLQHSFSQGQNVYYTWTITDAGKEAIKVFIYR